jgi:hypothetical protein
MKKGMKKYFSPDRGCVADQSQQVRGAAAGFQHGRGPVLPACYETGQFEATHETHPIDFARNGPKL